MINMASNLHTHHVCRGMGLVKMGCDGVGVGWHCRTEMNFK